ncbi:MAG: hypothetical protein EOO44_01210 [Flavobacterium sp.]|nr:MAG: hypothetical protein EOO44_01210 [Flavobacterium sp.]
MSKFESLKKIISLLDENLISEEGFQKLKSDIFQGDELNIDTIKTIPNLHSNKKECPNCKITLAIYTRKCSNCNHSFTSSVIEEDENITNKIDNIKDSDVNHLILKDSILKKPKYLLFKITAIIIVTIGCILMLFLNKETKNNSLYNETENVAIDSSNYNMNKDSLSLNVTNNNAPIDSIENNDFDFENFEGEDVYEASYVEKRCGANYYSENATDVKSMKFIVTKNKMVIKGTLVDLMINSEGIPEMNVSINSLKNKSYEDGKNTSLYDVTFYYNVSGGGIGNTLSLLKIWNDGNQITDIRITTYRTSECRFSFITNKTNGSNNSTSIPNNIIDDNNVMSTKNAVNNADDNLNKIKRNPDPRKDVANVFWKQKYTLFDFSTDEPIFPIIQNDKIIYKIYYSSNEDPKPYYGEFNPEQLEYHNYYKFKNKTNCMIFCNSKK